MGARAWLLVTAACVGCVYTSRPVPPDQDPTRDTGAVTAFDAVASDTGTIATDLGAPRDATPPQPDVSIPDATAEDAGASLDAPGVPDGMALDGAVSETCPDAGDASCGDADAGDAPDARDAGDAPDASDAPDVNDVGPADAVDASGGG